jgi:hypothetical protein
MSSTRIHRLRALSKAARSLAHTNQPHTGAAQRLLFGEASLQRGVYNSPDHAQVGRLEDIQRCSQLANGKLQNRAGGMQLTPNRMHMQAAQRQLFGEASLQRGATVQTRHRRHTALFPVEPISQLNHEQPSRAADVRAQQQASRPLSVQGRTPRVRGRTGGAGHKRHVHQKRTLR